MIAAIDVPSAIAIAGVLIAMVSVFCITVLAVGGVRGHDTVILALACLDAFGLLIALIGLTAMAVKVSI